MMANTTGHSGFLSYEPVPIYGIEKETEVGLIFMKGVEIV